MPSETVAPETPEKARCVADSAAWTTGKPPDDRGTLNFAPPGRARSVLRPGMFGPRERDETVPPIIFMW
jgi:hypothetical protein